MWSYGFSKPLDVGYVTGCWFRGPVDGFLLTPLLSPEQVGTNGMINEETRGILTQDLCRLFRE